MDEIRKFDFLCDNMPDGLVLIDEDYMSEFDDDMLYSFEVWLDKDGRTELVYDFPEEEWEKVWEKESALIRNFCDEGKMFVVLGDEDVKNCEFEVVKEAFTSNVRLYMPSGKLLVVNAGELIQCLAYPELEMEKILECDVEAGTYVVEWKGVKKIRLCKI